MKLIDRSYLSVAETRQRSDIPKNTLLELRDSIAKLGLLHPPAVSVDPADSTRYVLVAGERRLRAMDLLFEEDRRFLCGGVEVPPGMIPVTLFEGASDAAFEAELEENIVRVDLSWHDRTKALAELHRRRKLGNPEQTYKQTADELKERIAGSPEAASESLAPATVSKEAVRIAALIAPHLDNPSIAKARNQNEAYQLVLKQEEEKYHADLVRRRKKSAETSLDITIRSGSCLDMMPLMDEEQFDLILTDPPYGVGANSDGFRDRTVLHHNYDDSPENAQKILQAILTEGFRLTKPRANLLIFTDIKHFSWLCDAAARMAWTPWRFPVIWQKSTAEGLVPWGRQGFIHTYDVIFFATKGQRGLTEPLLDILNFPRVGRADRVYAAEKPIPLLSKLIEHTTLPGDRIFDPCAGSGSTLLAARQLKRHALGIEIDPAVVDLATVRLAEADKPIASSSESPSAPVASLGLAI